MEPPRYSPVHACFGTISSVFDFLTFGLLFFIFDLGEKSFQTGWFLESLATQVLVIFIIRTRHIPFFESRPSWFLVANTMIVLAFGWTIALSPFGQVFGFEPLPFPLFLTIIGVTLFYLITVEVAKRTFERVVKLEEFESKKT